MSAKGFLDLPRNVRDKIYGLLFTSDEFLFPFESTTELVAGIPLLRCSQKLCVEGCKMLYGSNKFVLFPRSMEHVWYFIMDIGEMNRRFLRHLCIDATPCQFEAGLVSGAGMNLVMTLQLLKHVWFETLELRLDEFSPHLPSNRRIAASLRDLKTRVLIVSQRGEIRYWKAMARTMSVSQLRILLPLGPGPAYEDLFDKTYFQYQSDLTFDIEPPKDHFSSLPPEVRNTIYEMLLPKFYEITPLDFEESPEVAGNPGKPWIALKEVIGLLRVSQQTHNEASSILYGRNVFRLLSKEMGDIDRWLKAIGLGNRLKLRYLRLDSDRPLRALSNSVVGHWQIHTNLTLSDEPLMQEPADDLRASLRSMEQAMGRTLTSYGERLLRFMKSDLELLQPCKDLVRLEVIIPMTYGLRHEHAERILEVYPPADETCSRIFDFLGQLHISQELRIGGCVAGRGPMSLGKSLGLERIVVFQIPLNGLGLAGVHMNREVGLAGDYVWQATEDHVEMLVQYKPSTCGTEEEEMDFWWPSVGTKLHKHDSSCGFGRME